MLGLIALIGRSSRLVHESGALEARGSMSLGVENHMLTKVLH